tara:strand:- start:2741 stop:4801 length:2061 start_codon:yes stop_codon:yes gene_type:complete
MQLPDRFGVLINCEKSQVLNKNDFDCYFENLIKNNNKIFLSSYVYQNLELFSEELLYKIVQDKLDDHVKDIRKNLRSSLRRNSSSSLVESLISIIKNFSNKIYNIEYFFKNRNSLDKFYSGLFSNIIGDPIIKEVLKKDIMIIKNKNNTKFLFSKINTLDSDFYDKWCIPFTQNCLDSYCNSSLSLIEDYPLPAPLISLHKFQDMTVFINKYSKHFNYINNFNVYQCLFTRLNNSIFEIAKLNNVDVIINFLQDYHEVINNVFKNSSNDSREDFQTKFMIDIFEKFKKSSLDKLSDIYIVVSKYYGKIFSSLSHLISKEISIIIQENDLYSEFNELLMERLNIEDNIDNFNYLLSIISYFDDKNIVFKRYHKDLMLRLLESKNITTEYIDMEKQNIRKLLKCFSTKQVYKLNRTVEDVEKSSLCNNYVTNLISESKELKEKILCSIPDNWNIVNTSYNIWDSTIFDIATRFDDIKSDGQLCKFFKLYSKVYSNTHENSRSLNWYLHSGCINMNYNTDNGVVKLKLLPLQALVLELFNDNDHIKTNDFFDLDFLSTYDRKEREKLLDVFIENNIFEIQYDKIIISNNKKEKNIDLISKYFQVSELPVNWKETEDNEIISEKEDVIKTKINHYLKIEDNSYDELLQKCQELRCFSVSNELFDKALDYMVKMDFVQLDISSNKFQKLLY